MECGFGQRTGNRRKGTWLECYSISSIIQIILVNRHVVGVNIAF